MDKKLIKVVFSVFFLLIFFTRLILIGLANESRMDISKNKVILDEQYVRIEANCIKENNVFHWIVAFEKKNTQNESRIRIAFDKTDPYFNEIREITGEGLSVKEGTQKVLQTIKVDDDDKDLDWYFVDNFSVEEKKGLIKFNSNKECNAEDLPIIVALDESILNEETVESSSKDRMDESTTAKENNESIPENIDDEIVLNESSLTELKEMQSQKVKQMKELSVRDSINVTDYKDSELGPYDSKDSFEYNYLDDSGQIRYPVPTTNDFTNPLSGNDFSTGKYINAKDNPLLDENQNVIDGEYGTGGANWRNYDYTSQDNNAQLDPDGVGFAPTIQLWETEEENGRTFSNSYLDYKGAFIKKWVEPITSHVKNDQEKTTFYNVYVDIIGGTKKTIQPVDIVFVLDKSASMRDNISDSENTKDQVLEDSVINMVSDLFDNPDLDIRIGMVDFKGGSKTGINSDIFDMSSKKEDILDPQKNKVLLTDAQPNNGTPMSYGIRKGYELLYKDNGETEENPNRDPEKILIVVGDGTPTWSYGGFMHSSRFLNSTVPDLSNNSIWDNTDSQVSPFWTTDGENSQLFRNYEQIQGGTFNLNEKYPNEFDLSKRPSDFRSQLTYHFYRFGEIEDVASDEWVGDGSSSNDNLNKINAVNTVAYHHWLKNLYVNNYGVKKPRVYSIGLGLASTSADAMGRNVLKNIADLKNNSNNDDSYYYGANSSTDLSYALKEIAGDFVYTIQDASLYDETGNNVSLYKAGNEAKIEYYHLDNNNKEDGFKYQKPIKWDESIHGPKPEITSKPIINDVGGGKNHAYLFSGISLGEGDMVRITYQVKLDAAAQNGNFYTVNNQAYLINETLYDDIPDDDSVNNKMFIPAPSIRYKHSERNIRVNKVDSSNNPISGVVISLYRSATSDDDDSIVQQIDGQNLVFVEKQITDDDGQANFITTIDLLTTNESLKYWIQETAAPKWYKTLDYLIPFQIKKEIASIDEHLGHYELTDFTGIPDNLNAKRIANRISDNDGKTESSLWPYVYRGVDYNYDLYIVQTLTEGEYQDFEKLYLQLDLVNQTKPIEIEINKTIEGTDNMPLEGAEFELYKGEKQENGSITYDLLVGKGISDQQGLVIFKKDNESVSLELDDTKENKLFYRVVESKSPKGFVELDSSVDYWDVVIDKSNNSVGYKYSKDEEINYFDFDELLTENKEKMKLYFNVENKMIKKNLQVKKINNLGQSITNTEFELRLENDENETVYKAYSGITGINDSKIIYNNDGVGTFFKKKTIEIGNVYNYEDLDFSKNLELVPGKYSIKETNTVAGYSIIDEEFMFEVGIDGSFIFDELIDDSPYSTEISEDGSTLTLTVENSFKPMLLELNKIDSLSKAAIEGAEFNIQKIEENGSIESPVSFEKNTDKTVFYKELFEFGEYKIIETKAPNSYLKLKGYIILDISLCEENEFENGKLIRPKGSIIAELKYYNDNDNILYEDNMIVLEETSEGKFKISFDVENKRIAPLPFTGGMGVYKFILAAILMIIMVGIVGMISKKSSYNN
ncbi:hypothetical protein IGI96_003598 [Enterococcus sp. DIV0421]|uniref:SpaA isopeptide-forming pilin-related protein n=1 Tax=Enterococcus sp. DIV0421 TaxID=2774688 RepID=UPI003F1F9029